MLRVVSTSITPSLNKLFNLILNNGIFPDAWRINTLTPLHKKGSALLLEVLRWEAIIILQNRLICFATENNLIPRNQIGYKEHAPLTTFLP